MTLCMPVCESLCGGTPAAVCAFTHVCMCAYACQLCDVCTCVCVTLPVLADGREESVCVVVCLYFMHIHVSCWVCVCTVCALCIGV